MGFCLTLGPWFGPSPSNLHFVMHEFQISWKIPAWRGGGCAQATEAAAQDKACKDGMETGRERQRGAVQTVCRPCPSPVWVLTAGEAQGRSGAIGMKFGSNQIHLGFENN